jgi:hypothetical protein
MHLILAHQIGIFITDDKRTTLSYFRRRGVLTQATIEYVHPIGISQKSKSA